MTNLKTTITAIVGAVVWVVARFGFEISAEITDVIIVIVVTLIGFFARDSKPNVDDLSDEVKKKS